MSLLERSVVRTSALVALALLPAPAFAQDGAPQAECADGVITSIAFDRRAVFDPASTGFAPLAWTYRTLNLLHVRTTQSFIRRELLFQEGDCFDPFLVAESERLLDGYAFLAQAEITDEDDGSQGKRVFVSTRDEWSTKVDLGMTYDAGPHIERFEVTEENFVGQGIFAEYTFRERRETKSQAFRLATPRFFGRADASIAWGKSRPGQFIDEYVRYPFIGETSSFSMRQGYHRGTDYFAFATNGSEPFDQVLVPAYLQLMELSAAWRIGEPQSSFILGATLTHDVSRFPRVPEVTYGGDFDAAEPWVGALPPSLERQLVETGATRLGLHLGTRRYRFVEYEGLDGVRDRQFVSLGLFAGVTVGRGFDVFLPIGLDGASDTHARAHTSFGIPIGSSILHGGVTAEARRDGGHWRDALFDGDLVAYLRNDDLAGHTLFLRASAAGGWQTLLPYQLSLGGREGVRGLAEDRYPGGRMLRFVVEDRIVLPWPRQEADLGVTLFTDVGRVWPGDVPYGIDSGWQLGVGFGLRIGLPAGTRNIWRTDIVFPVGPSRGDPVFRVTFELNRLRAGFFTPDVRRSRRLDLGPDHF
jgi:hypothetical protein